MGVMAFGAMNFLTMWFQLGGMSDFASGLLVSIMRVGQGFGSMLGGYVSDFLTERYPNHGRALTAQISKIGSTPIMFTVIYILPLSNPSPAMYAFMLLSFGLITSWTEPGCNAPVLSEIVPDEQRASILAWSHATSRMSGAIFGMFLTGWLAEVVFGYRPISIEEAQSAELREANYNALTNSVGILSIIPWSICAVAYGGLHWSYPKDKLKTNLLSQREDSPICSPRSIDLHHVGSDFATTYGKEGEDGDDPKIGREETDFMIPSLN